MLGEGKTRTLLGKQDCLTIVIVLCLYSKTGGCNGKHAWVASTLSITAPSYIVMQAYEKMYNRQFRPILRSAQQLQVKTFTLLAAPHFLCTLHQAPRDVGNSKEISAMDFQCFVVLQGQVQSISLALKQLATRRKGKRQQGGWEDKEDKE